MDTLFTGRHIITLSEIPSTNTYAMQLLKEKDLTEGTLIQAEHQTAGRGQMGHAWEAEKGKNLTFSLVMHPAFLPVNRQFYLSKITALAVLGTLTEFLPSSQYDIKIKWPNDVLVNEQKIAGILIENLVAEAHLQSSVVGVGFNVNQEHFGNYARKATSLCALLNETIEKARVLERFCKHFEALYLGLRQERNAHIDKQYLLNLYRYEEVGAFRAKGEMFEGSICGVSEGGLLQVKITDGALREFNFKEIEFL
jgi:BirA family biotin operon repressor/biotin-[acetyl-CoA-carboxylase] ligase